MEGTETFGEQPAPAAKKPRKPRPSEIAAKKAKAAKKKKAAKPKAKKVAKRKAKKPAKKSKPKKIANGGGRSERLDLRLTATEKKKLAAKARATRRTITSVVQELIERMK